MTEDPTTLVTGGTSGIGLATARLLVARGHRVAVTGRDAGRLAAVADDLGVLAIRADAHSMADSARVAAEVQSRFGRLTGIFLNAGTAAMAAVPDVTEAQYDEQFAVNTKGPFFTLQHALPLLADGGSILVTVGVLVSNGHAGASVAAGSHGTLLAMVPSLAREFAPRQIRVNAVSPGAIDTPMWSRNSASPEAHAATVAAVSAGIPFGRFGTAAEVGEAAAFLLSDASSYVTGQHLTVGGGL